MSVLYTVQIYICLFVLENENQLIKIYLRLFKHTYKYVC